MQEDVATLNDRFNQDLHVDSSAHSLRCTRTPLHRSTISRRSRRDEVVEEDGLREEEEAHGELRALVGVQLRAVPPARCGGQGEEREDNL